jgi:hypothetical protein
MDEEGGFVVGPTRRRHAGKKQQPSDRRRRRTMAILASALVTLPAGLSADVAVNWANAVDTTPLGVPRTPPTGNNSVPSDLGATGATPHDTQLSQQILHNAGDQAALRQGLANGTGSNGQIAGLPSGPLGIPGIVLDSYLHAQSVLGVQEPNCHLPWWLLAGIGKIESGQAEGGEVDTNGTTLRPILGPRLDGSNGYAALPAINGGQWTGDPVWQHAVGPMQFLPSTWLTWGNGGNPNNVYDASLAAGRYLCADNRNLADPAQRASAVFSYNHSDSYVQIVLVWANAYRNGVTPLPETTVIPQGPVPTGNLPSIRGTTTPPAGGGTTPNHPSTPPSSSTRPPSGTPTKGSTSTAPGSTTGATTTTTTNPPTTTTTTAPPATTTPTCPTTTPTETTTPTPTPTGTPTPDPCATTTTDVPPTTTAASPAESATGSVVATS